MDVAELCHSLDLHLRERTRRFLVISFLPLPTVRAKEVYQASSFIDWQFGTQLAKAQTAHAKIGKGAMNNLESASNGAGNFFDHHLTLSIGRGAMNFPRL
jgi:hypothetical protein